MAKHNETGKIGELVAQNWLEKNGYLILQTNWHWHHYELDIIALKDNELVVVEVRTRKEDCLVAPEYTIGKAKIRRIVAAADAYVRYKQMDYSVRFDIISILEIGESHSVEHIEDAFRAGL